jgi:1-acyl-sn-glycerol-3-phosphate acyltransferase
MSNDAAAVLAARSGIGFTLLSWYMAHHAGRHFSALRLSAQGLPALPPNRPAVIFSNHPSWWDPALYIILAARLFPGRPGYGPMAAEELKRYPVLRKAGVFGIDPATPRGAVRFLRVATAVLENPAAMLWITAEGAFTDSRLRPLNLRAGLAHLARKCPGLVMVPLALDYPFWNQRLPEALMKFGPAIDSDPGLSVADWTERLQTALTTTLDGLVQDATKRDPRKFVTLVNGQGGIGGVYQLWRRIAERRGQPRWRRSSRSDADPLGPVGPRPL